ncbi:MAG: VOC family protein [Pseudomonadota bacterium]
MPHFEIYVSDVDAAKAFYEGLFGWIGHPMPAGADINYHVFEGTGIGEKAGCTIGMLQRPDTAHPAGSAIRGGTIVFDVDDCDERYAWALANGGAEAMPPTDYPSIGRCAYVEDGFGNVVGMIKSEGAA